MRGWRRRQRAQSFLIVLTILSVMIPSFVFGAESGQEFDFNLLDDCARASHSLFDHQNQITFAVSIALIVGAHQIDPSMRDYFSGKRRVGDFDRLGNDVLGTGIPGLAFGSGLWIWGAKAKDSYHAHAGQAVLESLAATEVATIALKGSVLRDRPDGSDRFSFPSGHTSTMAALATSLEEFYGWKVGVPAFVLTALTAASRMSSDRHWFSDTVAGASLGVIFGHSFSRAHLEHLRSSSAASSAMIVPVISPGGVSLAATWAFD